MPEDHGGVNDVAADASVRVVVDVGAADADGVRGDAQLPESAGEVARDLSDPDVVLALKNDGFHHDSPCVCMRVEGRAAGSSDQAGTAPVARARAGAALVEAGLDRRIHTVMSEPRR